MLHSIYVLFIFLLSVNATGVENPEIVETASSEKWIYTVRQGDTISQIAKSFLASDQYIDEILRLNEINDPKKIRPGQRISIPKNWLALRDSAVTIDNIFGQVTIYRNQEIIALKKGDLLYAKDEIETDKLSSISLKFVDDSIMIIESESRLELVEILENVKNAATENKVKLEKGRYEMQANPQKNSHYKFEIETPSAVSSIRGTFYRVGSADDLTRVEVLNGRTVVKEKQKESAELDVKEGKGFALKDTDEKNKQNIFDLLNAPVLNTKRSNRLSWDQIKTEEAYRIQLSKNENFNEIQKSFLISKNSISLEQFTNRYEKIYMRVRGIDENGLEGYDVIHLIKYKERNHKS